MNRDLYIITIGFIILGLGVALLSLGEDTTFFIFPFFFAGNLAPLLMLSFLFITMMCFWWVNKNWTDDARFKQSRDPKPVYLRVSTSCQLCGSPLPQDAAYCFSCGNPVERLRSMDVNGDGQISRDEVPQQAQQQFERMDENGDGVIDAEELERLAERFRGGPGQQRQARPPRQAGDDNI